MAQTTYINSHLIRTLLPEIPWIKKYLMMANNTDKAYRDVRPLMSVLQRLPQADLWLVGLLQTRKYATLGYDYSIEMPDNIKATPIELKRISEIKNRFVTSRMRRTFSTIISARIFGQAAARLVWQNVAGLGQVVTKIQKYELTALDVDPDNIDSLLALSDNIQGEIVATPLDPDVHIQAYFNPLEDVQTNYVGGVMRTAMFLILLKYLDRFNWARQNEKWGDPSIWGTYKKGTDAPEVAEAFAGLVQLAKDNVGITSDDITVRLLESVRTGMVDMHDKFQQAVDKEISISMLGQTLTTDVGTVGSKAAAAVHNFVRQDYLWGDIEAVEQIESEQYIQQDWKLNYNDQPGNAYPILEFKTDDMPDYESRTRVVGELLTANVPLKKNEVYSQTGFTEPESADETFQGTPKPAAIPPFGGGG